MAFVFLNRYLDLSEVRSLMVLLYKWSLTELTPKSLRYFPFFHSFQGIEEGNLDYIDNTDFADTDIPLEVNVPEAQYLSVSLTQAYQTAKSTLNFTLKNSGKAWEKGRPNMNIVWVPFTNSGHSQTREKTTEPK